MADTYWQQFGRTTQPVAPPGGTPTQPVAGGESQDWQQLIQQWQQAHPYGSPGSSIQDLNAFLNAHGVQSSIPTHAGGTQLSTDKIVLPDQSVWDISNDNGWQSGIQDGYFVNGQPSATPNVVTQAPDAGASGPGIIGSGVNGLVPGQGYQLPTADQALNSPGLQFALQQGEQGIMRNAAARGTLRSGGTLKDLASFDIGTALQGYNQLVNQQLAANQYNTGSLFNIAGLGENAAAQTGNFGQNYAQSAGNTLQNLGNAQAAGSIANGNNFAGAINNGVNDGLLAYYYGQLNRNQPKTTGPYGA